MSVYVWTGTVRTGIDTVEDEFGQTFNLKQYIVEKNSTIGIDTEIINFPDSGIHIQDLIYFPLVDEQQWRPSSLFQWWAPLIKRAFEILTQMQFCLQNDLDCMFYMQAINVDVYVRPLIYQFGCWYFCQSCPYSSFLEVLRVMA